MNRNMHDLKTDKLLIKPNFCKKRKIFAGALRYSVMFLTIIFEMMLFEVQYCQ
jgi:hypothetical protein